MNELKAYFLTGCTASGKTSTAHYIAKRKDWAILSTDSMQVYRHMNIGTAKASKQELDEVEYYGIDLCEPSENYSLWNFHQYAKKVLGENQDKTFIITGGTGLYIKALVQGLNKLPGADEELRSFWNKRIEDNGIATIRNELQNIAPEYLAAMTNDDRHNARRLIRALELVRSEEYKKNPDIWTETKEPIELIGLSSPTEVLNKKIAQRVHKMYDEGLIDEVRQIISTQNINRTAAQAIGYAEAIALINGELSEEEAKEKTIVRTRRLAKKQRTWFRHQARMDWIDTTGKTLEQVADSVLEKWRQHGRTKII